jgi:hypothetical protein
MKHQRGYSTINLLLLIYVALGIAGAVGWVMNLVDIANSSFSDITGMLVLRIIGVFIVPLGAVLGYF